MASLFIPVKSGDASISGLPGNASTFLFMLYFLVRMLITPLGGIDNQELQQMGKQKHLREIARVCG
jgi:hypothetical protein